MEDIKGKWPKKITVDKRIVRILSGSTYANFPTAIREIINNSYDADAINVSVNIDIKKEIITIQDDGKGMNESDFSFYLRIAGKTRKKDTLFTKANRRIIGQFGVGFLSALPFCEKYLIETSKKGSEEIVHATITSSEYLKDDLTAIDVEEIPILGGIHRVPARLNDHFTRIRLVGFSKLTRSFFRREYAPKNKKNTIYNLNPLDLFRWELCEYLPLDYIGNHPLSNKLNSLFKSSALIPFNVKFNGEKLHRHIHADNIIEISNSEERIGDIVFKYAILTNYDPIDPTEARHLMFRNLNVGVGERTALGLGLQGKVYGKLAHLTGEVNVIEGLNDLISVSRDKFNYSPDYEKLKDFLSQRLSTRANELDTFNRIEKTVLEFEDKTKVSNIDSLKLERVHQEIASLISKGFEVTRVTSLPDQALAKMDRVNKELILSKDFERHTKVIRLLERNYKLNVEKWDYSNSDLPAIRIEKDTTIINEDYPLFQNNHQFDTFLKLHILLLEYYLDGNINRKFYSKINSDLLKIFNAGI